MFARKNAMKTMVLLVAAGVVAGAVACTTPKAPETPGATVSGELTALSVTSDELSTVVTLVGVDESQVMLGEHSDPWSVSIDLGAVPVSEDMAPVAVYDGLVDQVSAASFTDALGTPSTRVEIALAAEGQYDVASTADGVSIRISPAGSVSSETSSDAEMASDEDVWGDDAESIDESSTSESMDEVPAPPAATTLTAVSVDSVEGGVLVHLSADGVIGNTESFTLENPDRLVIDLPGMASTVKTGRIDSESGVVASVRIGAHADKVRVVMDGGSEAMGFQGKQVMPSADGLWVTVGDGEAVTAALSNALDASDMAWAAVQTRSVPASIDPASETEESVELAEAEGWEIETAETVEVAESEEVVELEETIELVEMEEATPEFAAAEDATLAPVAETTATEPITVFGIEYETDMDQGVERIVIVASGATNHATLTPDSETVMIRIPNAVMAKEAEGRIATREGGPLSLISAFQQPDVEPSEVRIVVKRTADLDPQVVSVGSNVFVEFAIEESAVAEAMVADAEVETREVESMDETTEMELAVAPVAAVDPTEPTMPMGADMDSDLASVSELPTVMEVATAEPIAMVEPTPASIDLSVSAPPASLEPPAAIEVLQEGGLIDGKDYRGRRISLDFKDVAISDVLRLIAEVSDLNIISGDEVSGNVSIRLVDVPWDQALDVILLTKGLGFVRVGNVLRIAPGDVLAQEEEVRLQERRAKEKLEDLVVKLIPVNYGDVKDMSSLVKRLLTARGSVNVDVRTSTLIVKDIASVIDETTALVAAVDTETPQVMIEAKIVEANLDFARELGSVWAVGKQQLTDPFDNSSPLKTNIGGDNFRLGQGANNTSFLNNITAQPTALFNLSAFLLDDTFNIDVQLQAAESTGNGKVVSSPRIVTLDNSPAQVQQGVSIPFQTFENGDAKLEFIDAVLSLKVTPHITADKSIIMEVEVTRDAPDASIQTQTGSPAIAKNQAKTETLVKDSQTLVLGGIYTVDKTFRQSRVPYLHRLPIVGAAFKSKEVSDKRKELLIFVTPRIVMQPGDEG